MDHRQTLNIAPPRQVASQAQVDLSLRRVQRLARWLDSAYRIPGTRWRIGWDVLLGLIPGLGDTLAGAASAWILIEALRLGASWRVLLPMLGNLLLDLTVGSIPVLGDLFDAGYKSNLRNARLLERYLATRQTPPPNGID